MEYFTFIIYTLLFITILTPVAVVIFDFFDIRFEVYGNYLLWFIALALFNAILPFKINNIFADKVATLPSASATNTATKP
jgi:hypothetical protein